jgi:hypothetical protein
VTGLHNGTFAGDIALFNNQGAQGGQQGQVRLAGFTASVLCPQRGFCLVLDGGIEVTGVLKLSVTTCGRNLFHDCVDPVLTPRSQYDLRSVSRKKLRSAFSQAAAGSGDHYHLVSNI